MTFTSKRKIVLDTETTGLNPYDGHRIIEIGCVELIDSIEIAREFQTYINPDRDVPEHSVKIHGITTDKLISQPRFAEIASSFLDFIQDSILIIHNASFDLKFLNYELKKANYRLLNSINVIDTLSLARQKFPGSPASLDALCKRFNISLANRKLHGALLDAKLLAQVYLQLMNGDQTAFTFDYNYPVLNSNPSIEPNIIMASPQELIEHQNLLKKINNSLWKNYDGYN